MGLAATSLVVGALALGQSLPGQGPIHSAWARHALKETLSVAGFVLGAGQTPADPDSVVLVLQVDDRARVPPEVKANARTETLRIFAAAGVRVIWVDGDAWAEAIEGRTLLVVRILDQAATEWLAKKLQLAPDVGGQATPGGTVAHIFYSRVAYVAGLRARDIGTVVGVTIAHEVGHLLLKEGHSLVGVMRADLDLRPLSGLEFTRRQSETLRAVLRNKQ